MSKNKKKTEQEIKDRGPTWEGFAPRFERTKRERERDNERKERQRHREDEKWEDGYDKMGG